MFRVYHGTGKTCSFFQTETTWGIYQNMFSQREFGYNTGKMLKFSKLERVYEICGGILLQSFGFVGNFELGNIPVIE